MTTIPTPSEPLKRARSGHWYRQGGELVELVPSAKGEPIAPSLVHARKLDLAPGQSAIRSIAAKPALDTWKVKQGIMAALTLPRGKDETDEQFLERVLVDSEQTALKAAQRGTELHKRVEDKLATGDWSDPWVEAIAGELARLTGGHDLREHWRCETPGTHVYGFGTTNDLHLDYQHENVHYRIVADIKGCEPKRGQTLRDQRLYDDHHQQLAATREVLGMGDADCRIIWLHREKPEAMASESISEKDLAKGWSMFCALLNAWQVKNSYRPSWSVPVY